MAESTPPSRAPEPSRPSAKRPLRLIDAPARGQLPSHPPSEPRPVAGRPGADAGPDRPARVQLIAALLLLLVLVVVPLYLWRRPRVASTEETKPVASAIAPVVTASASAEPSPRTKNGVTVSDAKVVACHDPGPKRTSSDQCDHLPGLEASFAKAILDASACVPEGTPAGAIAFVIDVSYARHHNPLRVRHRREDTTMPPKVVAACVADLKKSLSTALDQAHAHSRYEIQIDATYGGKR